MHTIFILAVASGAPRTGPLPPMQRTRQCGASRMARPRAAREAKVAGGT